ncbi:MAG TPA: glutamate--cysteine ligase [Acetobacteraceae bacterium]|nr:glutamate--cysteine ligase [Acetobacteraceae bacterium]
MSNPGDADTTPILSTAQLADYIAAGCKPPGTFRIGTEHEKFGFRCANFSPPPYAPNGIRAVLEGLAANTGAKPILDQGQPIGLKLEEGEISLEPGGQFELSGAPVETLHETRAELAWHFASLDKIAAPLGIGFVPLGFHPLATREAMAWMPKSRYAIMRAYMPKVGHRGLDMMLRTCTVQVNLDYASEEDMVRKLRVALCLQPLASALFANSPFSEGKPNGFLSLRAEIWRDTDPDRTGIPATFFEKGFGFERYVEWLLDVPMYFIRRRGAYLDLAGRSFRDFMAGRLPEAKGERASLGDFADHMTTVFTDVRLKRFLEMRGADASSPALMLAQSALWVGLLYDPAALATTAALIARHPWQEFVALRDQVPRLALATPWQGGTLRDLARDVVAIAADGLAARGRRNSAGEDERIYLAPLQEIAEGAPTAAEHWLTCFHGPWKGDVRPIFKEAKV